jgi:hypothetical protein
MELLALLPAPPSVAMPSPRQFLRLLLPILLATCCVDGGNSADAPTTARRQLHQTFFDPNQPGQPTAPPPFFPAMVVLGLSSKLVPAILLPLLTRSSRWSCSGCLSPSSSRTVGAMRHAGEEAGVSATAGTPSSCTQRGRASSRATSSAAGPPWRRLPRPSSSTWGHWRAGRTRGAATRRHPATRSPGARAGRPSSARSRRWRASARRRRRGAPAGPPRRPEKKSSTRREDHRQRRPPARAGR